MKNILSKWWFWLFMLLAFLAVVGFIEYTMAAKIIKGLKAEQDKKNKLENDLNNYSIEHGGFM